MSQHTIVSSDDLDEFEGKKEMKGEKMDLHEAVSSEELLPEEAEEVLKTDDFEGFADEAGLEEVEGFDESYALSEAELGEEVAVRGPRGDAGGWRARIRRARVRLRWRTK